MRGNAKIELFENAPIPAALAKMALPTIVSQLITLIYNIADTWFIGRRDPRKICVIDVPRQYEKRQPGQEWKQTFKT